MWPGLASIHGVASASSAMRRNSGELDVMALYGFLCLFFTGVFLIYQKQFMAARVGLIVCLLSDAVYASLEGVWPLACLMIMWAVATIRQPTAGQEIVPKMPPGVGAATHGKMFVEESRISRMFGPTQN